MLRADDDRPEIGVRDPDQLSLTAGDGAVERGVAEELGALPLRGDLGGFTLREQAAVAHPA